MAGAIPCVLSGVPPHHTTHVGARRGAQCDGSGGVAIRGNLGAVTLDDPALSSFDGTKRLGFGSGKSVANQVVRVVDVFFNVVPHAARDCLPAWVKQVTPRIRPPENGI